MPHNPTTSSGAVLADPREPDDSAGPPSSLRLPSGRRANFDEIVTPHPVVAFLFRRRTFIVLLCILALVPLAQPVPWMLGVGTIVALLAEAFRLWAAGTIHKTEELTTGGPYGLVRHPLYVGSFLHAVAYCFMSGHWWSFLLMPVVFCPLYGAAVATEEAMLTKLYASRYEDYMARVPRFIPRWRVPERGHGRFDWRQTVANKEYVNIIWMALISGLFLGRLFWAG